MTAETSYDTVPYPTGSYSQTHPDRLATVATLLGLSPAPPGRCRVLEIGCGNGGNLIPMAFAMPGSTFTGIDLAATPIAEGARLAEQVGLKNITLLQQDLTTYAPEAEAYDYVLAHGVYAWVAPPVQDRLLAVCRAALAPQGVAFVSYNALPGSHLRLMLREMMRYHIRSMPDPKEQQEQAKALLAFLRRAWPTQDDFRAPLGKQAEMVLTRERDNLFHDELSEEYRPLYFHEFAGHAARHGMQYLAESDFFEMNESLCPPAGMDVLRKFGPDQIVEKEQYMDFLKCRAFRQTLLCRRDAAPRRDRGLELVDRFLVETRAHPTTKPGGPDLQGSVEYRTSRGATMTTVDPFVHKLMDRLERASPWPLSYAELLEAAGSDADLRAFLLRMYSTAIVELRLWSPPCVRSPGERPEASRLARAQLERRNTVTSLVHTDLNMVDPHIRALIRHLDGTRDRAALLRDLAAEGVPVTPGGLEETLRHLAKVKVLVA